MTVTGAGTAHTRPDEERSRAMRLKSLSGILVMLLFTASLAVAAPATGNPSGVNDGYRQTVAYFQLCRDKASEIEAVLQALRAESIAASPHNPSQQQTLFQQKLISRFPGATFDGTAGTIPLQHFFTAHINSSLKVESIRKSGPITVNYLVSRGRITVADSTNAITILLDQDDPARSLFVDAIIPGIQAEAEKIVTIPGWKRVAADRAETSILNDAYQLMSLVSSRRMDVFALTILTDPEAQQELLRVAAGGYQERHRQDYQAGGAVPPATKVADSRPGKGAEQVFSRQFGRLSAFILLTLAVLTALGMAIRASYLRSRIHRAGMREDRYRSLSPMVTRALHRTGRSLWGRNLPWAKSYYIYERSTRWLLCDGVEDKENKIFRARTRIEVSLRSSYFKLSVTRLNGGSANIWLHCHGVSQRDLHNGLAEICREMTNPSGRDDGVDADDTDFPEHAAGSATTSATTLSGQSAPESLPEAPAPAHDTGPVAAGDSALHPKTAVGTTVPAADRSGTLDPSAQRKRPPKWSALPPRGDKPR